MKRVNQLQENVFNDIQSWVEMYRTRVEEGKYPEKYQTLYQLLRDFEVFSRSYRAYIESDKVTEAILTEKNITETYLKDQVLEIVLDEWDVISQTLQQRELSRYENWLLKADKKVLERLPKNCLPMVTMLGKANTSRFNLYSPIAIASIPRDQYPGGDLMGLSHEVGHHVYASLKSSSSNLLNHNDLRKVVQESSNEAISTYKFDNPELVKSFIEGLLLAWMEEIFADLYGTLLDGAKFIASYLDILSRKTEQIADLLKSDGDHPSSFLRFWLRVDTLRLIDEARKEKPGDGEINQMIDELESEWTTFLQQYPETDFGQATLKFKIISEATSPEAEIQILEIPLYTLRDTIHRVIQYLFEIAKQVWKDGIQAAEPAAYDSLVDRWPQLKLIHHLLRPFSYLKRLIAATSSDGNGANGGVDVYHPHEGYWHSHVGGGAPHSH